MVRKRKPSECALRPKGTIKVHGWKLLAEEVEARADAPIWREPDESNNDGGEPKDTYQGKDTDQDKDQGKDGNSKDNPGTPVQQRRVPAGAPTFFVARRKHRHNP